MKSRKIENGEEIKKWEIEEMLVFVLWCLVEGRKMEGWKTLLLGWEEKWEDEKYSLFKFTLMPVLNK